MDSFEGDFRKLPGRHVNVLPGSFPAWSGFLSWRGEAGFQIQGVGEEGIGSGTALSLKSYVQVSATSSLGPILYTTSSSAIVNMSSFDLLS